MQNNLAAAFNGVASSSKLLLGFCLTGLVFLLCGCSGIPSAERFLFTAQTNAVPVVTNWTATVSTTNAAGNVETLHTVHWATNIQNNVTWQVSTNAAAIVQTGAAIGNIFSPGWGEVVGMGAMGLLAVGAKLKSRKVQTTATATGAVMAQTTEMLLAIIETTKGKQFTDALKLRMVKDQNAAGVLREVAKLVETTVDNDQARALARTLLESLPQEAKS